MLTESPQAGTRQWSCRVGHRYSQGSLADAQADDVEAAMWAAVRALEDRALLLRRLADQFERSSQSRTSRRFRRRSEDAQHQAHLVRGALAEAARTSLRAAADDEEGGSAISESVA